MLGRMAAKRLLDVCCATLLLLVLTPVLVVVLVAMALDLLVVPRDRGSFLYREPRISRGRTFSLLKFRTLRADVLNEMRAAGSHARLYEADPANLTRSGRRVLKPWYLDELPQLINVLRGDISLVGPRPWPPEMVERQAAEGLGAALRRPRPELRRKPAQPARPRACPLRPRNPLGNGQGDRARGGLELLATFCR